jgi:ABC-type nitrate/sulfonate/bicarbonate transport system permease component
MSDAAADQRPVRAQEQSHRPSRDLGEHPPVPGRSARRHRVARERLRLWLMRLAVPAVAMGLWFLVTNVTHAISPVFLPAPTDVFDRIGDIGVSTLLLGLRTSVEMVVIGFAIGGLAGTGVGLLFGYSRLARELLEFSVDAVRPVPLFALIPLFILWFGIGMRPQIMLVATGVFLMMTLATIEAVRNVPFIYVRAALTLGATRFQIYRTIVIPAIVPTMLVGVRYAIAAAWGLDVAAEFIGSQQGLGYLMIVRQESLDTAGIILIVLIFCILAIVADRCVRALTRHLTRWSGRETEMGLVRDILGGI